MTATPTSLAPKANGRYVQHEIVNLVGTATTTVVAAATATSASMDLASYGTVRLDLHVSVATGTLPTLDVTVQTSPDGTNWSTLGTAFTQATAATDQHKVFAGADRYLRAVSTIGGTTPSFTYSLSGSAV